MRPCEVTIERTTLKATFHAWSEYANVIGESPLIGGHASGQIKYPVAVVEYEDGQVNTVPATCVKFTDVKPPKRLKVVKLTGPEAYSISLALSENNGYCPCELKKTPDTKCMCKAFREQKEPGKCHCGLFAKVEE